ncbi:Hypothetical predicted protein [Xyrichtys novacula]|uniref:Uncharacterized protein n=1 Tax=Xyrichtys novacula TaxID=13765 RepID=A0AAV1FIK4_XYRNO|nr:Hypothetical predicted protein [Xyrichtys novacula]
MLGYLHLSSGQSMLIRAHLKVKANIPGGLHEGSNVIIIQALEKVLKNQLLKEKPYSVTLKIIQVRETTALGPTAMMALPPTANTATAATAALTKSQAPNSTSAPTKPTSPTSTTASKSASTGDR